MRRLRPFLAGLAGALSFAAGAASAAGPAAPAPDPRMIENGRPVHSEGYADQPYIVKTDDGAWLCAITTGAKKEGSSGQHVVSMRSRDQGRTWEPPVDIEPANGPEASYAVLLKTPGARVYAFYNYNADNVRRVKREDHGYLSRVDSLGYYVFRFTDDGGRTWSPRRYTVPVREFANDRANVYGGKIRFFWNVGRPLILGHSALLVLHKVGAMGAGFFAESEGAFLRSENLLTERDPERITFETLPDGDVGLRAPPGGGRVAEEQSLTSLSDGSLYCVYRTTAGWPACAYSADGGHTWTPPEYAAYWPGGPRIKHPRAANFVWRCSNGKFLYWFHNHGGPFIGRMSADSDSPEGSPYNDRNPVWLSAGTEHDTPQGKRIYWSQPEIVLYDDDPYIRMSYPDLVEDGGAYFLTETQKSATRVHEVPRPLLEGLFNQEGNRSVARDGLEVDWKAGGRKTEEIPIPRLPELNTRDYSRLDYGTLDLRAGFSLDLWLEPASSAPGQVLLDSRDASGKGISLVTAGGGAVRLTLNDGRSESAWESDSGRLAPGSPHHVAVIVDGGPKIITFVIDGILCDGGDVRQFGWGRYSPNLRAPNGSPRIRAAAEVRALRIYGRALRTSEAVGNFRAGAPAASR